MPKKKFEKLKTKTKFSVVGDGILAESSFWTFDNDTPKKFNNHAKRSIPFYEEGHSLIAQISDFFVHSNSVCYELGAATAVLLRKLAERHKNKQDVRWIGLDREPAMIKQAKAELKNLKNGKKNIELIVDDINLHPYEPSDFIVSYYTIQFVPPRLRQKLINRIYETLNWGGAFVLFEKIRGPDARFQDLMSAIYTDFKISQGYNSEEILGKARSLKGVLEPFSTQGNLDLLKRAGFVDCAIMFKYNCFEGFLCIK